MSVATPQAFPFASDPSRKHGRRRADESAAEREKHIQAAALLLGGRFPGHRVAALFDVSPRTVFLWKRRALGYDEPEAEALRRLA